MANFLDETGLARLWEKIKAYVATNGTTIDLLWANGSSTSSFGENSVPISNISDYRLFVLVGRVSTSNARRVVGLGQLHEGVTVGNVAELQYSANLDNSTTILNLYRRWMISVEEQGIHFYDAGYKQGTTVKTDANTYLIPVEVYGIKGA